jgi:hypothetical protein
MAPVIPRPHVNHRRGVIARAVVTVGIVAGITIVVISNPERETETDPD